MYIKPTENSFVTQIPLSRPLPNFKLPPPSRKCERSWASHVISLVFLICEIMLNSVRRAENLES